LGITIWCACNEGSACLERGAADFKVNFRVANLHALLDLVRHEGCPVEYLTEKSEQGKIAWVTDPEGIKVEFSKPPLGQ